MENIIISKEFLDWYEYYNECKEKYSSLVNDVEDKLIRVNIMRFKFLFQI